MSNLSFFKKYIQIDSKDNTIENNIYGLTGTIGSGYNKKILFELYKLESLIIPPFKESLLLIETPKIILINKNENQPKNNKNIKGNNKNSNSKNYDFDKEWEKEIKKKIKEIIGNKRAVLVVFQYINQAKKMYNEFKNNNNSSNNIILYTRSDSNQGNFLKSEIEPGTIIFSTNISGRGTDIRINDELRKNGGLHVILTYEPFNKRIERQAFGRAGRNGDKGSAGKIIISHFNEKEALNEINKREEEESNFLITKYSEKMNVFEKIFLKFSNFLLNTYEGDEHLSLDLKERWGHFLIKSNLALAKKKNTKKDCLDDIKNIEKNYNDFEKILKEKNYEYYKKNISKIKGYFLGKNDKSKETYEFMNGLYLNKRNNIKDLEESIKKCPYLCLGAYMIIICNDIKIIKKPNDTNENSQNNYDKLINKIDNDLNNLISKIKLLIKQFEAYKKILGFLGYNKKEFEIFQQNEQKLNLMNEILNLMKENQKIFNVFKNSKDSSIKVNPIKLENLIKIKGIDINKIVFEYFLDYGLYLFVLTLNNQSICNIF